jgi:hypothetical protein
LENLHDTPDDLVRDISRCLALRGRNDAAARAALNSVGDVARTLQKGIRYSTASIDLSDAFYKRAFLQTRAMSQCLGPNTFFYNINPADMYSCAVLTAAGEPYVLTDNGVPDPNPSVQDRWRLVASNFHACKELLDVTHRCIERYIFGWNASAKRQDDPNCFMGVVLAHTRKVEESGRLALHIHGSALPLIFSVDRLRQLFAGPNCAAVALASAVISMWLPTPYRSPACPTPFGVLPENGIDSPRPYPSGPAAGVDFLTLSRLEAEQPGTCAQHLCRVSCAALFTFECTHTKSLTTTICPRVTGHRKRQHPHPQQHL